MDDFKRAGFPGPGDWWQEYPSVIHTSWRRRARRALRQRLQAELPRPERYDPVTHVRTVFAALFRRP